MLGVLVATVVLEGANIWLHYRSIHSSDSKKGGPVTTCSRVLKSLSNCVLKMFNVCLGYLVMLSVMSMNIWLFVAAILGSGLGHLFVRPLLLARFPVHEEKAATVPEAEILSVRRKDPCHETSTNETVPMLA